MNEIVFVVAELLKQFAQIEINKTEQWQCKYVFNYIVVILYRYMIVLYACSNSRTSLLSPA